MSEALRAVLTAVLEPCLAEIKQLKEDNKRMSEEISNIEAMESKTQHLPMNLPKSSGKAAYENIVECEERVLTSQRRVRVWFSRTAEGPESIEDWTILRGYVHDHRKDEADCLAYAVALATELPRVNAVEVRDGDHGSIYYPEWP